MAEERPTIESCTNESGQQVVTLSHSSGATATIYAFGATVTDFTTASGRQVLWTSSKAKLDGTKAIRGGIPLAFPQFGQPDKRMAQHGFARISTWELVEEPSVSVSEIEDAAVCVFKLNPAMGTHEAWPFAYEAEYVIAIGAETMVNTLSIRNTGDEAFSFQCLIHTYFNIQDITTTTVTGFQGALVYDKIGETPDECSPDGNQLITIDGNVDRVYVPEGIDAPLEDPCVINTPGGNISVGRTALYVDAEGGARNLPVDTVVWNPWIEKAAAMADFEEGGWQRMLCVEPGLVNGPQTCEPQAAIALKQVIRAE